MEVEFVSSRDPLPNGSREKPFPIVRRKELPIHDLPFADVIKAAFLAIRVGQSLAEPRVFVGSVVHNEVDRDADAPLMGLGKQAFEIIHRPICRVDGVIIRDVVSVVVHGGSENRANPKQIHAEISEIIEP